MGGWGGSSHNSTSSKQYSINGFSVLTRRRHYDEHGKDYNVDSVSEYEKIAVKFRNKKTDSDIHEFVSSSGLRFKYDRKNNDFLIYKENGEIVTLYKPEKGYDYWERQVQKYGTKE
jgi:pyocin large subunit-like protein